MSIIGKAKINPELCWGWSGQVAIKWKSMEKNNRFFSFVSCVILLFQTLSILLV